MSNRVPGRGLKTIGTEQARSLGILGAPSFLAAEELFWGNDRLEAALDWLQRETR